MQRSKMHRYWITLSTRANKCLWNIDAAGGRIQIDDQLKLGLLARLGVLVRITLQTFPVFTVEAGLT